MRPWVQALVLLLFGFACWVIGYRNAPGVPFASAYRAGYVRGVEVCEKARR